MNFFVSGTSFCRKRFSGHVEWTIDNSAEVLLPEFENKTSSRSENSFMFETFEVFLFKFLHSTRKKEFKKQQLVDKLNLLFKSGSRHTLGCCGLA